jgi:hypothetical protein
MEHGYAGSFHVYGLGVPLPEKASIHKSVIATEGVRAAVAQGGNVTVTVVTVPDRGPMTFDDVRIVLE